VGDADSLLNILGDVDLRLVAGDTYGFKHTSAAGQRIHDVLSFCFTYEVPWDIIEKFQFETRPITWVEFSNVLLVPGKKTDVKVEVVKGGEAKAEEKLASHERSDTKSMLANKKEDANGNNDKDLLDTINKAAFLAAQEAAKGNITEDTVDALERARILAGIGPVKDGALELMPPHTDGTVDGIGAICTDGKLLLFSSNRGGDFDIYSYSMKTGKIIPLVIGHGDQILLDWSPAAGKIIYESCYPDQGREFFVADSDGRNPVRVFEFPSLMVFPPGAAFSPDGKRIVFPVVVKGESFRNLYMLDLETNEVRRLVKREEFASQASWSPDGKYIAYCTERWIQDPEKELTTSAKGIYIDLEYYIYIANVEDGSIRRLDNIIGKQPAWSPDGKWIAFIRQIGWSTEIYITPAQGEEIIQVTDGSGGYHCWSPDGKRIIFTSHRDKANVRIFTIDVSKYLEK